MKQTQENTLVAAIFSDSHGNFKKLKKAIKIAGKVDIYVHLGDHDEDVCEIEKVVTNEKIYVVRGNNDFASNFENESVFAFGNSKIMITHGHLYGFLNMHQKLFLQAKQQQADAILFGHTHIGFCQSVENVLVANPGSVAYPRDGKGDSFGKLFCDLSTNQLRFEIINF